MVSKHNLVVQGIVWLVSQCSLALRALSWPLSGEYNSVVYGDFLEQIKTILRSKRAFDAFKTKRWHSIWTVFFMCYTEWGMDMIKGLHDHCPHHLEFLPQLAEMDSKVGHPIMENYTLTTSQTHLQIKANPAVVRYLFELCILEHTFGSDFSNMHVIEIGGGYGGLAATMMMAHAMAKYSIVDFEIVGQLIHEHAHRSGAPLAHIIKSTNKVPVASDLLVSFFCISEQTRRVVDRYIQLYVAHAKRGYLQLNYDEDLRHGGNSILSRFNEDRYNMLELFQSVYQVQASAVLLPPPSYAPRNHRIRWGPATGEQMFRG